MASGFSIRKNQYYDSVFLMGISKRISDVSEVRQNAVLMGSDANKALLRDLGIQDPAIEAARPNDLVVAVIADTPQNVDDVLRQLDDYLLGGVQVAATSNPHSLDEGLRLRPNANLAVISIPGEYAAHEARKALEAGLNVFLFSDHVSVDDERALKETAAGKNLLVMGPDCGTAIVGGIGLGFADVVRRGTIGVVGGAGTGLQEFTSQIHNAGYGISHAIGTGGRDLSDDIGGLTTFAALNALEADPQTAVIAVISKLPGPATRARLIERLRKCQKPVAVCFLETAMRSNSDSSGLDLAFTIDDGVQQTIRMVDGQVLPASLTLTEEERRCISEERSAWAQGQKYLRGVMAGGTLCYQAQQILRAANVVVHSNAPLDPKDKLSDSNCSAEHTVVDMGADEYTLGKPHPMIDPANRRQRIRAEARDPEVGILLLDFILGYNASMDPVGDLLEVVIGAQKAAQGRGGKLTVVASVCGTDGDPQDVNAQVQTLRNAGVMVFSSSARAVSFCAQLLRSLGE